MLDPFDLDLTTDSFAALPEAVRKTEGLSPEEAALLTLQRPDLAYTEISGQPKASTDLIRLYLQDIGRIPLLKREEEVALAQQIQRYLELVNLREQALAQDNPALQRFVQVIYCHDSLLSRFGHRPCFERWAQAAGLKVNQLKEVLALGKQAWADLANLPIATLEILEKEGIRAKAQMIKANLRLVVSVAKKYQNRGLELLDLVQEGTLGLERAVEKFDPTKGYRFSTYAYWWIRQGITRAIATQGRMIRLPVHITEKLNRIKRAQRKISQDKGRMATLDEVAYALAMTPSQIREVLTQVPRSVSLELKIGQDKDTELLDLIEATDPSPEASLIQESLRGELEEILTDLTPREQEVIALRYGFQDGTAYSLSDIGRILRLSRERVRQIEAKALQKLRHPRRRDRIRDYFDNLE